MKFENINGVEHIVLEENDKIKITTKDSHGDMTLDVECKDDGLNISGNSSLINTIKGDGMLEKVYIQPTLSADEIIDKCDQWLEMFKKVHDKFRELVLTDSYREQDVSMDVSFCQFFSFSDETIKGRKIEIDLKQFGIIIQEGLIVSVDEANEDVYKYLLANVLDYYLSVNYAGTIIEREDIIFKHILYSNIENKKGTTVPMLCGLGSLFDLNDYTNLVLSIVANHNLKQSSDQIIDNLKRRICNQQMSSRFDSSIEYSIKQYEHVISNSEKAPVLSKKMN